MKKVGLTVLAASSLAGCYAFPSAPPETLKEMYAVEATARQMKPDPKVGLLYIFSDALGPGRPTRLVIDREYAMEAQLSKDQFYVFCLEPGKYTIDYQGDVLITDREETLDVKAGDVISRIYSQGFVPGKPTELSRLIEVKPSRAQEIIATARIGTDWRYGASRFRCQTLPS